MYHTSWRTFRSVLFGASMHNAAVTLVYQSLCRRIFQFLVLYHFSPSTISLLGIILGHMVTFWKTSKVLFQRGCTSLPSHLQRTRVSVSLPDILANISICLFCFSHPYGCLVISRVLFCILLRTNDVDHLFLCSLSFCISSLEKLYSNLT